MPSTEPDGVLVVDKPVGPTSHDVVARVRRILSAKVGHTGTLDPGASGVLPLVTGRATRLASLLQAGDKRYTVQARLGVTTDTYDWQGRETLRRPVPELGDAEVEAALEAFRGAQTQQVPAFSAVRVEGERLYEAARRGQTKARPSRQIEISRLELLDRSGSSWTLDVTCSAGTYIRSLVHDLGETLGCGAIVESLRRVRAGSFTLEQAVTLEAVESGSPPALIPLELLLPELPAVELSESEARRICHGNPVHTESGAGSYRLFAAGQLVAIGKSDGELMRPRTVLRPADMTQSRER